MKMLSLVFILLLGVFMANGCTQYGAQQQKTAQTPPALTESTGSVKEFTMTAKRFEFDPSTIDVNKGDIVKITITSVDVAHGFNLPAFGVNEKLEPGNPVQVVFVADKQGTFAFSCSIPCGSGHRGMVGQLVVR